MKHDIVYLVKDAPANEELRYSLRSVCENFPFRKIWFYGGRPSYLKPDEWVHVVQNQRTKWMRTTNMIRKACENPDVTEDFWLFNDDFFVMDKMAWHNCWPYESDLYKHIVEIENRHGQKATAYTKELRWLVRELEQHGLDTKNYALHMPILINKEKALQTLDAFPNCPMFRSLYGNMHKLADQGGIEIRDVKIAGLDRKPDEEAVYISTTDDSFASGKAGEYIRRRFPEPCKYEL